MEIVADTIAEAHERVVKAIVEDGPGVDIETSPGKWEKTWEYPGQVQIVVLHPDRKPQVSEACNFGEKSIALYCESLTKLAPPSETGFKYTYANRLFDYPSLKPGKHFQLGIDPMPMIYFEGSGTGRGIDQIRHGVIDRLVQNQESRRALAITWVPLIDIPAVEDQPCLQFTHFLIRDGQIDDGHDPEKKYLHLRAPFRSHDMLGGYGPNAVALEGLMEYVRNEYVARTGIPLGIGTLTTTSSSAHIYWRKSADDLKEFKRVLRIS